MSEDALRAELGALLRRTQAEERIPSLVAAVFRGDEVVWSDAAGLADAERGEEATVEHQYRIGSITKTFVAAAILQLRDAGALDLDDRLANHVPESPHSPTLRRMLAHLSGLQREFPGRVWEGLEMPDRDSFLGTLTEAEHVLAPAKAWHYSNLAFALLGEVVERRSGLPVRQYVEERLLAPVGLSRTSWDGAAPTASGYLVDPYTDRLLRERADVDLRGTAAAGGLWSTVGDLCRWGDFLCKPDESVLASTTADEQHVLQTMVDADGWTYGWGLGVALWRKGEHVLAGHSGGMPGHVSLLSYSRRARIGSAVFYGTSAPSAKAGTLGLELTVKAIEALPAVPEPWRPESEDPPPEVDGVLGRWWTEGHELVISWRQGRLEVFHTAAPAYRAKAILRPDGPDRYRVAEGFEEGELLEIVRDESGAPERLYLASYPVTREPRPFA